MSKCDFLGAKVIVARNFLLDPVRYGLETCRVPSLVVNPPL